MRDQELETELRASAPEPRPEWVASLERRVEAGFPAPAKPPRRKRKRGLLFAPAVALACSLVALVVVVGVLATGGTDSLSSSTGQSLEGAASAPAPSGRGGGVAPSRAARDRAADGGAAPGVEDRRIERSTTLALTTGADEFGEVNAEVLRVSDAADAIVLTSTVSERDGRGFAAYELRVPTVRLDATLAQLSQLGAVRSRTAESRDVTGAFVSARDRLADARAERAALLRALAEAPDGTTAASLRARLRTARSRLARAEAAVRRVERRAQLAPVSVTVESTGTAGAWTPGDALRDAGRVLEVALGVALVALAVLAPFAVLALLAAVGTRMGRRRRREAVLAA